MICRGKGKNKEYCSKVIKEILEHWDELVWGKTTNQKEVEEDDGERSN